MKKGGKGKMEGRREKKEKRKAEITEDKPSALVSLVASWAQQATGGAAAPSRPGENSVEEKGSALRDGEPPCRRLLRAISAKEVTRGGGGVGIAAARAPPPSLRRTGQLSMRSREPSRGGPGDLSRLRS